jgi:hypothetical protein
VAAFLLPVAATWSAPPDPENYEVVSGGIYDITDGSILEGSVSHGGLQPDYRIQLEDFHLKRIREYASNVGKGKDSVWTKIQKILHYVSILVLPEKEYDSKKYLEVMKKYKSRSEDIPLAEYPRCGAGVCREHALLTHFALKEAGIPNHYVYARVLAQYFRDDRLFYEHTEDHAFNVVEVDGEKWIADSYNSFFNGMSFDQLQDPQINHHTPLKRSPLGTAWPGAVRKILQINSYPKLWRPIKTGSCASKYSRMQSKAFQ